jgi:prevent-host-death family protein
MPKIRPISDLRNKFAEISKSVHQDKQPVFLTKNGVGDMVVMSHEFFEQLIVTPEILAKIKEAEAEMVGQDLGELTSAKEHLEELAVKHKLIS